MRCRHGGRCGERMLCGLGAGLEQAGLGQAGLQQAGLQQAGLEQAGLPEAIMKRLGVLEAKKVRASFRGP